MHPLINIIHQNKSGCGRGIYSCCSANQFVLRAAIETAKEKGDYLLVEATANQVDQYGGYTGMKPKDFAAYVRNLAQEYSLPQDRLILGGDHLGPLTFCAKGEAAMEEAEVLVAEYVRAGFTKIHLDTSMRLSTDSTSEPLPVSTIAERGARLCAVCESVFCEMQNQNLEAQPPVYVIGSEVPIPGGAQEAEESIAVTTREAAIETAQAYKSCFEKHGLNEAWQRVAGLVVQPGVEFGDNSVFEYNRKAALSLKTALEGYGNMCFEAHSTDYQSKYALRDLVEDGFAILKVGPALTFALREAMFALSQIEDELASFYGFSSSNFKHVLISAMENDNSQWKKHYHGTEREISYKLKYSFSDRARYYLPSAKVVAALQAMTNNLDSHDVPLNIISQYMPQEYTKIRAGDLEKNTASMMINRVKTCIDDYIFATTAK